MEARSLHAGLFAAAEAQARALRAASGHVVTAPGPMTFQDGIAALAGACRLPAPASRAALHLLTEPGPTRRADIDGQALLDLFLVLDLTPFGAADAAAMRSWPLGEEKGRDLWRRFVAFTQSRRALGWTLEGDVWRAYLAREREGCAPELPAWRVVEPPELYPLRVDGLAALGRAGLTLSFGVAHEAADRYPAFARRIAHFESREDLPDDFLDFVEPPLAHDPIRLSALRDATPDARLRFVRPLDRADMVQDLSQRLLALLDNGVAPHEILVVAPNLEALRPLLREALLERGLPFDYRRRLPLWGAPGLAAWPLLAEFLRTADGSADDLFLLDRAARPFGLGPQLDEGLVARATIEVRRSQTTAPFALAASLDPASPAWRFLTAWREALAPWRDELPVATWLERLQASITAMRIPAFTRAAETRGFTYAFQARRTLLGLLDEWRAVGATLFDSAPCSFPAFFAWLQRVAALDLRQRDEAEPDRLAVVDPSQARETHAFHVFFLDAIDPCFPAFAAPRGYLSDAEWRALEEATHRHWVLSAQAAYQRAAEDFAHVLLTAPNVTVYAPRTLQGETAEPSPLLDGLLSAFREEASQPVRAAYDALWSRALHASSPPPSWPDAWRQSWPRREAKLLLESARHVAAGQAPNSVPTDGAPFLGFVASTELSWPQRFSYGWFDDMATCPFKCLAARFLKAEPLPTAIPDLSSLEIGRLLHDALVIAYGREAWACGENAPALTAHLGAFLRDRLAADLRDRAPVFAALAAARATPWAVRLVRLVRHHAEDCRRCPPWRLELGFGDDTPAASPADLRVTSPHGDIRLTGRLDRVDVGDGRAVLSDYKSGRQSTPYRAKLAPEAFGRTAFQIPIYLLALREALREAGREVRTFEARYLLLGDPTRYPKPYVWQVGDVAQDAFFSLDESTRAACRKDGAPNLANHLADLFARMQAGLFPARPTTCDPCPYLDLCRYEAIISTDSEETLS